VNGRPSGLPPATGTHPVWQALSRYEPGPAGAALPFADRLARENGWSAAFARRVLEEYRRFLFLAATGRRPATPSDAVDQAWHLHLTYSRDYWERLCAQVLGRPLHHDPTAGGADERHRFYDQYAATLKAYEDAFGAAPPADIWPGAARRLLRDPGARRVHPRDALIVPRRAAWALAVATLIVILLFAWGGMIR
jgi:hypothetical protein